MRVNFPRLISRVLFFSPQGNRNLFSAINLYRLGLPPPSNSHHLDYEPFLVGNPYKPSFATVTGWGVDPIYRGYFIPLIYNDRFGGPPCICTRTLNTKSVALIMGCKRSTLKQAGSSPTFAPNFSGREKTRCLF